MVFLFYTYFNGTKFIASRSDGQRLLLESSLYGTFLLLAGYIICRYVIAYHAGVYNWWQAHFLYFPLIGPPLIALALGIIAPYLLNIFVREKMVKESSYKRFSDSFGLLLYQAQCQGRQVAIDLKNHKVYVGLCIEFTPPGAHDKGGSIIVQPVLSGYRDSTTHKLILTTDYSVALKSAITKTAQAKDLLQQLDPDSRILSRHLGRSNLAFVRHKVHVAQLRLAEAKREEDQKYRDLQIALLSSEIMAIRFFDYSAFITFTSAWQG